MHFPVNTSAFADECSKVPFRQLMPERTAPILRPLRLAAVLLAGWAAVRNPARAQDAGFDPTRIPKKDVVVMVDVSGSVHPSASIEAGRIVRDLILGQLNQGNHPGWDWSSAKVVPKYPHFQAFLDGNAGGAGLTEPGRTISIERIGERRRVSEMRNPHLVRNFPGDVFDIFQRYPKASADFQDQETYFELAMAGIREVMRRSGDDGFYLFVISDGVDDKKQHNADDQSYIRSLRNMEEEHFIAEIHLKPERLTSSERIDRRISRDAPRDPMDDFFIRWYAVGRKEPQALAKPEPPPVAAPRLPRAIQLLGGLAGRGRENPKEYRTSRPFLAWQVANHTGDDSLEFTMTVTEVREGQPGNALPQSDPLKAENYTRADLGRITVGLEGTDFQMRDVPDGLYHVVIRPRVLPGSEGRGLDPGEVERLTAETWIRVSRPFAWWPWATAAGVLCGAGLFYSMWRTLRSHTTSPRRA